MTTQLDTARAALAAHDNPSIEILGDDGWPLIGSVERAEYVIRALRAVIEPTGPAAETVAMIRGTIEMHDNDVFRAADGGYLLDGGNTIISVTADGGTSETPTDWSTGWEA